MRNIVVAGATGHFGARICRRLVGHEGINLFVSSRTIPAAQKLANSLRIPSRGAAVEPVELDQRSSSFSADLGALDPDVVIHTAGPYQGQDYAVARACLEQGSHYIDLADGREFVEKFECLNREALDRDLLLVTGASTLPGLSSAVVSSFEDEFTEITAIETTIAPAHQTPRGRGTIAAVMSYCGKPFDVLEDGAWRTRHGWQNLRKVKYPALGTRYAGACDVPDLALFPGRYKNLRTATFHAALAAPWEQLSLWCMAGLTRAGLVRDWSRFTPLFQRLSQGLIRLGSDRGGMSMRISGTGPDGNRKAIDWLLVAGRNHGPEIPCTPALVLVRKLLEGSVTVRGAMPCLSLFTLDEFAGELEGYDINWSHRQA